MRFLVFLLMSLLSCSCELFDNNHYTSPKYVLLADDILKQMEKKLSKKYQMKVISDTAALANSVNVLGLGFEIQGPLTQDQLRIILVGCVEEFLLALNSNVEIRPFLKTYPFTAEGIDIAVFVVDSKRRGVSDPYIGLAETLNGELRYKTIERKDGYKYKHTIVESYAEAIKIVNAEMYTHHD